MSYVLLATVSEQLKSKRERRIEEQEIENNEEGSKNWETSLNRKLG